jgi:4'-phosphopantetheinyl transferase
MIYRIFDDMGQCCAEEVARLLPLVSDQRREQALRFSHLFGQYCCLKSYELLCELLREWGSDIQQPFFDYNEYGAPSIQGGPYFSISHCKEGIAVAVDSQPIGIDIESVRPFKEALMHKTMNPAEQAAILSSDDPDWAFTRLWTQKEAVLKMQATGIISDLHEVLSAAPNTRFTSFDNANRHYVLTIAQLTVDS